MALKLFFFAGHELYETKNTFFVISFNGTNDAPK